MIGVSASAEHAKPLSLEMAWIRMRSARPFAYPNLGFTLQLMAFEEELGRGQSVSTAMLRAHSGYRFFFYPGDDADGQEYVSSKLAALRAKRTALV